MGSLIAPAQLARISAMITGQEDTGYGAPIALMAGTIPIAVAPAADAIDRPSEALSALGRRRSRPWAPACRVEPRPNGRSSKE